MDSFSHIKETDLLIRYLAQETDARENDLVRQWLEQSPENIDYLDHLKNLWNDHKDHSALDEKFETIKAWDKMNVTLNTAAHPSNRSKNRYLWYAAAASFFILISIGYFLLNRNNDKEIKNVSGNEIQKVVLPDRSIVWLNCNSELRYHENFKRNRNVTLSGEGYFEVEPDKSHPFEIFTSNTRIKVLGTKFNVKAYPTNAQTEVVVTSGKVLFTTHKSDHRKTKELILTTGEKAICLADSVSPMKVEVKNPNYLSWKTHEFVFDNTNIKEIVAIIISTYHINMVLDAKNTQNCNLSGTFTEQSLNEILDMLQVVFKITYEKENDTVVIKSTGCQ